MDKPRCCVCHQPFATADVQWLGGRPFCERHHALALEATATHWSRAGLVETGLLAGFVGIVTLVFGSAPLPTDILSGAVLAVVPALIFLVFVYRQDRIEPEPAHLVIALFLVGGLLGASVVDPLSEHLLGADLTEYRSGIGAWVASIGVRGTRAVLFTYLAVRYTVYLTPEFDEPVDGIVYATAAMLGMATASNVAMVTQHQGVLPVAGATAMASTTLVSVATGALLGYGLGRARFDAAAGQHWLTTAFGFAILVHGTLHEIVHWVATARGVFDPLLSFGVALVLAAIVLAIAHFITARFARRSLEDGTLAFN